MADSDLVVYEAELVTPENDRADYVRARLAAIRQSMENNFFDACELLLEAQENDYQRQWGYARFDEWVEEASNLDMSVRQAYYLIGIAKKARSLGLSREQLKQVKISKLKEIFSLDPQEHEQDMRNLLEAGDAPLEEVKEAVRKISGRSSSVYMTVKFDADIKETVRRAFELARRNYGDQVGPDGEIRDISDSKCLELICVEYLQDINNYPEGVTQDCL